MRLPQRSIAVALVAPMLALAVSAYGFIGLRCRVTGMVSIATCCPQPDSDDTRPEQSSADDPGCCERLVVVNAKPAVAGAAETSQVPQLAAVVPLVVATGNVIGFRRFAPSADPPDVFRPPLHLLHRSLLI